MVTEARPMPEQVRLGSPAHGFYDDEATRRLFRSRPPRRALAWAENCLGGRVVSARALRGGMPLAVHLLNVVETSDRECRQAVLRRYVREELNEEEPDIAEREARVLRFVENLPVPTPRLLGVDPTGERAGTPAVLMSRLSGRVDWWPKDMDCWLRRLAELLPQITPSDFRHRESSAPTAPTRSRATSRQRGRAGRGCGNDPWRYSTDRHQILGECSSNGTSTPAMCCGTAVGCRVSWTGRPPASVPPQWTSATADPT